MTGDGGKGWPEQAPFERIIVTAAAQTMPQELAEQLAVGGIMVVPIGRRGSEQSMLRVRREASGLSEERLSAVRFVPLVSGMPDEGGKRADDPAA